MSEKNIEVDNIELRYKENIKTYQSANAIFNFMKEPQYLEKMLKEKAITPRYYFEHIDYLKISFKRIAFPMTCFCDINLHKIKPHTVKYGEYGIAFNKEWGIKKKVQPIHYVNINSVIVEDFTNAFNDAEKIDISDNVFVDQLSDYMLTHLLYMKPLNGYMTGVSGQDYKNFQDECEWRYVPNFSETNIDLDIIYTDSTTQEQLKKYNDALNLVIDCKLNFSFEDVKYLVVPTEEARENLIKHIISIKDVDCDLSKYKLISKIIVLSELEEDV